MKKYLIKHSVEVSQQIQIKRDRDDSSDGVRAGVSNLDRNFKPPPRTRDDGDINEAVINNQLQNEIANGNTKLAKEIEKIGNNSFKRDNLEDEIISYIIRKSNSCYLTIQYPRLMFLDILMFLCVGTNLEKYMKCFDKTASKMCFPYEWVTDSSKLKHKSLPSKDSFYNRLKNSHISDQDYQKCLEIWDNGGCKTFLDYLIIYNISDIKDLPHCTDAHAAFFKNLDIDLWKDGLSLPALVMSYMFKTIPKSLNFALVDRWNESFYWKLRRATQGGLSIVINREMVANRTLIRDEPNGKTCKSYIT